MVFGKLMKNVGDAGFSRKRGGNAGSGPPLPDPVCFDLCHSVVKLLKVFQVLTVYLFDSKTFQIFTSNTLKVHH